MCGICGLIAPKGRPVAEETVLAMRDVLIHRGPDDAGLYVGDGVALGHRRLSIIDLSPSGHQPMSNDDQTIWIAYNGEIYNFKILRAELEQAGCRFRSRSDTEVLIRGYEIYGDSFINRCNGMFAVALYDLRRRRVILLRDRFGVKPLYYADTPAGFAFASEMKAFSATGLSRRCRSGVLLEYINLGSSIGHQTPLEGIYSLPQGHRLEIDLDSGKRSLVRYYDPLALISEEKYKDILSRGLETAIEHLEQLLLESVERRLISDVPVGTLCSGGIDSSLITALARRIKKDVMVFNVDVRHPGLSEDVAAKRVARHLGIDIHSYSLDRERFVEALVDCVYYNDTPLIHPNGIGIYYVSKLARENGIIVLLTGEGADELLGGYRKYVQYHALEQWLRLLPRLPKRLQHWLWMYSAPAEWGRDVLARLKGDLTALAVSSWGWFQRTEARHAALHAYRFLQSETERKTAAFLAADLLEYLEPILQRQDRMSMQPSVESRVPFLDYTVVEFALNVPLSMKIRGRHGKWILKRLAERYIPHENVWRAKIGFDLPLSDWVPYVPELMRGGFIQEEWKVSEPVLRCMMEEHPSLRWMLTNIEIWGRVCVWDQNRTDVAARFLGAVRN